MVFRNNSGRSGGRQTLSVGPVEHRQMNELLAFQGVELWCEHVRNALLRLLDQRPAPAKNCVRSSAHAGGDVALTLCETFLLLPQARECPLSSAQSRVYGAFCGTVCCPATSDENLLKR